MKTGPNEPCPCGSGRKYKKCHGAARGAGRQPVTSITEWLQRGRRLEAANRLPEAEHCFQQALGLDSTHPEGWLALGRLAERAGDFEVAHACFDRLTKLHPRHPQGLLALGNARVRRLDFSGAQDAYRRAVATDPGMAAAWFNLGNIEGYFGRASEGLEFHRRAIGLNHDLVERPRQHSHVLITLHRDETLSADELFREHHLWAQEYASALQPETHGWKGTPDCDRPLQIGYVSGSFNGQIVGHFLSHVLENHDRHTFHVTLYSSTRNADATTSRFKAASDDWVEIAGLDDEGAANLIRTNGIDILVDIDGHSPTGRPLLFARKPAPVQISWLDWFNTTGLATMDYILTDPYTTPANSSQRFTETPYCLPHSRFCYSPPVYAPPVAPPPSAVSQGLTFGSFNRQDKLHPELLRHWAEILCALPSARLLLKNRAMATPTVRAEIERIFGGYGVMAERLILRGPTDHARMLAEYGEVDIALDTFPYNGGLTSCECLWMGVPIVALEGERMVGRQTSALLRLLGLDDWVATSHADYVNLAVEKSRDLASLARVRAGLRDRVAKSPLADAAGFCRDLEAAYRDMWRQYCQSHS